MVVPDLSVHIVQRGHDGNDCFFDDGDYLAYLNLLREFAPRCGCSVHAYCLMTNHVHLFLTPHAPRSCALLMKNVGQRYVQRVNALRERRGTLWEGRFYSCLVPTEAYALACYRYVECNPLKPGLVSHPDEYPWSSYRLNARAPGGFLSPHPAYSALAEDDGRRAAVYRELCNVPLPTEMLENLRKATRCGSAAGTQPRRRGRPKKLKK
ncbi:MAG TPA: transposase [Burkholderiales bacterium]|nr:transposase [Burkholderiales bacterium]